MRSDRENRLFGSMLKPVATTTRQEPERSSGFMGRVTEFFGDAAAKRNEAESLAPAGKYAGMSKDDTLAAINEQYWQDYLTNTVPIEDELFAKKDNINTVDAAQKDAVTSRRILGDMANRNKSRYGMNVKPSTSAYEDRLAQLGQVRGVAKAGADARINDEQSRLNIISGLATQGATLRNNSQSGLGMAANLEANRNAQHSAAKSQASAQRAGMISSGIGLGLMAFGL
jgi:hypothetical protein